MMFLNGGEDFQRQGQGGAAILIGDDGLRAGADGVEKGFEFQAQGFVGLHGELAQIELRGGMMQAIGRSRGRAGRRAGDIDAENVLARVIDRKVLVGLEEAEFAHLLRADTAGGEVGDTSGFEFDADVGDVNLGGKDGQANGVNGADRRGGEGADDIEVVNHEVEDDINIQGAGSKDAETVRLKKHGVVEEWADGLYSGIEALQMPRLQNAAKLSGEADEMVSLCQCGSDGLFDEDIDPSGEEGCGHLSMVGCGHGDRSGMKAGLSGQQRLNRRIGGDGVFRRERGRTRSIWLNERGQLQGWVRSGQLMPDAQVIFAEGSAAENGNPDWTGVGHAGCYLPATVRRQRA